jgi:hypothetical protein
MTSEMNNLLEKLQEAIDAAIAESGAINDIVAEMKKVGYDLCLVLESTAAISPIDICPSDDTHTADSVPEPRLASNGELDLTIEDVEFLEELNISIG